MRKAFIDCGALVSGGLLPDTTRFILSSLEYIQQHIDEVEWHFVVSKDKPLSQEYKNLGLKNIHYLNLFPGGLQWKFWYGYQLPNLLKKQNADFLITTGGAVANIQLPQMVWLPTHILNEKAGKRLFDFYKKKWDNTLKQAHWIIVCSEKTKMQWPAWKDKMVVARPVPSETYHPLSWAEKESIKVKYAAGKEYYLIRVQTWESSLVNLLKSFSLFKKRLQSNMQLVFVKTVAGTEMDFLDKLASFKYRTDVHVLDKMEEVEYTKLLSAAYGLIDPYVQDEIGVDILNAFKAHVPVLATKEGYVEEIAGKAALYAGVDDVEQFANHMIALYKDEQLRQRQITQGETQLKNQAEPQGLTTLLNAIQQLIGRPVI